MSTDSLPWFTFPPLDADAWARQAEAEWAKSGQATDAQTLDGLHYPAYSPQGTRPVDVGDANTWARSQRGTVARWGWAPATDAGGLDGLGLHTLVLVGDTAQAQLPKTLPATVLLAPAPGQDAPTWWANLPASWQQATTALWLAPGAQALHMGQSWDELWTTWRPHLATWQQPGVWWATAGHALAEAGATPAQQLALTLAELHALAQAPGLSAPPNATVQLGLPPQPLLAVAMLRAWRALWHAHGPAGMPMPAVLARGLAYHNLGLDARTNLIRQAVVTWAAYSGGADAFALPPWTPTDEQATPHAHRLTQTWPLLATYESHLDAVADPLAGAHAVEALTAQLVDQALATHAALFPKGLANALEAGQLQTAVRQAHAERHAAYAQGERPAVGANRYRHPDEADLPLVQPAPPAPGHPLALLPTRLDAPPAA